jgi:hypothetical protein
VVFFSISDTIEMSDVNHINILFAIAKRCCEAQIAVRLMVEAEKNQVQIPQSTKDAFYKWFATKIRLEEEKFTPVSTIWQCSTTHKDATTKPNPCTCKPQKFLSG